MPKEGNGMPRRLPTTLLVSICATIALGLTGAASAAAATHTVNDPADAGDATVGDGACDANLDTDPEPECTLRAAIEEANALPNAVDSSDQISFQVGLGAIVVGEVLPITEQVFIDGNGSEGAGMTVVDGNDSTQIFNVSNTTASVNFEDMRLQNGFVTGVSGGGAAINTNTLTELRNVVVTDSSISGLAADAHGAGVFNTSGANLTVRDSQITSNVIETSATGNATGAGIASAGPLNVLNSVISGNQIIHGGGTAAQGGGIRVDGAFAVDGSTIVNNQVNGPNAEGGGIFNGSNSPNDPRSIRNSTIGGNGAGASSVGAGGVDLGGDATITNVTFANNTGGDAGAGRDVFAYGNETTVTAQNSIFASDTACGDDGQAVIQPASPNGHNIDAGTSCGFGPANGNLQNTDPMFSGGLNPFGGGHQIFIPLWNSPAIDNADPGCGGLVTDQRGEPRPQGGVGNCDIGAYERDYRALNVSIKGSGTVTYAADISCVNGGGDCTHEYVDGQTGIVLTATPAAGFQLSSWQGCTPSGSDCAVDMGNDRLVTANFSAIPSSGGGSTGGSTTPTTPKKKCKKGKKLKKGKCVKKKRKKKRRK